MAKTDAPYRATGARPVLSLSLALGCPTLFALGLGAALYSAVRQVPAPELTADSLVARVQEARQEKGMRGTAVLIQEDLASGVSRSRRLAITSATHEGTTTVLYLARATAAAPASAVLITLSPGRAASGCFLDGPDSVQPLTPALLERPFLATDLTIGDLTDDFLAWPSHRQVGNEKVLGRDCMIVESRPPSGARPAIARVRSWIARSLALPLKVEKYDAAGTLRRRFAVERVVRLDAMHWGAAVLAVSGTDMKSRTKLKIVKGDRHAKVLPQEFAVETIRRSLQPRGRTSP